ncbi:MAG TPA: hypothetical protein ENN09_00755, partial [Planctomycetes bacterium]|nr:hypothetical protein [Planctomycetota bacterium]
ALVVYAGYPLRAKGVYMSDEETERIVKFWRTQKEPEYSSEIEEVMNTAEEMDGSEAAQRIPGIDDKSLDEAIQFVIETGRASASSLQAQFGFGYPRANKLIQAMEALGIVGESRGSKFREVFMTQSEWDAKKEALLAGEAKAEGAAAESEEEGADDDEEAGGGDFEDEGEPAAEEEDDAEYDDAGEEEEK